MSINWFMAPGRAEAAGVRLFCLPYAGGSAAVYRPWAVQLAPEVEVLSAQLAGRGWRLRDRPVTDLGQLAGELAGAIAGEREGPFAVFGHSMGAWLGLEVVRRLESLGRRPVCFFASGRQAPVLGCTQPLMSHLSDADFVSEVQTRYGGIPTEILSEPELLALLLPALRADIALLEGYSHRPANPVSTPIHALVGERDAVVAVDEMAPWASETTGGFDITTLRGGHFYFQPDAGELMDVIRRRLCAEGVAVNCAEAT